MRFGKALRGLFNIGDGVGIEKFAEVGFTEKFAKLILVDGESLGAALGQRGIAIVEEVGDVAEEERCREGRGLAGFDYMDAELALFYFLENFNQSRHVEDIAETLPVGLEQQWERRITRGDAEQIVGAFSQLPERRAGIGAAAREKKRPASCLAKTSGE